MFRSYRDTSLVECVNVSERIFISPKYFSCRKRENCTVLGKPANAPSLFWLSQPIRPRQSRASFTGVIQPSNGSQNPVSNHSKTSRKTSHFPVSSHAFPGLSSMLMRFSSQNSCSRGGASEVMLIRSVQSTSESFVIQICRLLS